MVASSLNVVRVNFDQIFKSLSNALEPLFRSQKVLDIKIVILNLTCLKYFPRILSREQRMDLNKLVKNERFVETILNCSHGHFWGLLKVI